MAMTYRSGIALPAAPFQEWVESMIDRGAAKSRVAARLHVSTKRLDELLAAETIDEAVVDRAVSAVETVSLVDLYPDGPLTTSAPSSISARRARRRRECATPDCRSDAVGGRFCEPCKERLDRVGSEIRAEAEAFRSRIGRKNRRAMCCVVGCDNPRPPRSNYCRDCESERWDQDDDFESAA